MSESVRDQYNSGGLRYLEKRKNPASAFWNDQIERPGMWKFLESVISGKSVLDAGCGYGEMTSEVAKKAKSCVGIDLSETMIGIGKTTYPILDLRVASIEGMPFNDGSFDVVYSSLVLHYLKDLRPALREVARVLKKGGFFVFSIHHPFAECTVKPEDSAGPHTTVRYFHNDRYEWEMAGMVLESYHHTLEDISTSVNESSFSLEAILEPRPSPESESINPSAYRECRDYPKFCVFKVRKV